MSVVTQENLKFRGVNFISLNYHCNKPYENEEIDLDIKPAIFLHEDSSDSFEIIMSIKIEALGSFSIQADAVGTFTISEGANDDYRNIFMNVNAPAIMFPYVRAFITTITSNFGTSTGTIIIPAQRFIGDLEVINPPVKSDGTSQPL